MMLTLNDGRTELWQWDTGRTLSVDADCSQVHFSNKVFGRSIDVDVVSGVAIIPDVLLQVDKELTAWAFVGPAADGYTKISKTFKVNRRNKPADYVFTPVEQTTISEIKAIAQSVRDDADAGKFNGKDGVDGYTPVKGVDYFDGVDGKNGVDGKTPVKGEDYWTATDKQEIVNDVLEQIEIPEGSGGSAEVPVFDLASRGVPAVTLPQGTSQVAGDMSDIVTALSKGSAIFKIPVSLNGMEINISLTMQAFTDGSGGYQCVSMVLQDVMLMAIVSVNIGGIVVAVAPAVTLLGLPFVTGVNNGQIMQVVNGTWTSVPVAESAVKTYVDEYLSAALEGDY